MVDCAAKVGHAAGREHRLFDFHHAARRTMIGFQVDCREHATVGAAYGNKVLLYNNDGTTSSLLLYDMEKEAILDVLPGINIINITQDKDLSIYLSVLDEGIKQIDFSKLSKNKIAFLQPWFSNYAGNNLNIENLFFDNSDNIWFISSATGCLKFNKTTHLKTFYRIIRKGR